MPWISLAASVQFFRSCICFQVALECFHLLLIYDVFPSEASYGCLFSFLLISLCFGNLFPYTALHRSVLHSQVQAYRTKGQRAAFPVGIPVSYDCLHRHRFLCSLSLDAPLCEIRIPFRKVFEFLQEERSCRSIKSS